MELKLKKKNLKALSIDDKALPAQLTPNVAGGGAPGTITDGCSNSICGGHPTYSGNSCMVMCGQPGQPGQPG